MMTQNNFSDKRIELQNLLENILGSKNVYFQPPESIKLKYPCVVYELSNIYTDIADDIKYRKNKVYTVTVMDKDPDSMIPDLLIELDYCSFDRFFISSNLNHWVFRMYF